MTLLAATAAMVFLLAIQQQNVVGGHYAAAAITSAAIAGAQFFVISIVADGALSNIAWMAAGGAIGVTSAMWAHRQLFKNRWRSDEESSHANNH